MPAKQIKEQWDDEQVADAYNVIAESWDEHRRDSFKPLADLLRVVRGTDDSRSLNVFFEPKTNEDRQKEGEEAIIRWQEKQRKGMRVLDLGCGTARNKTTITSGCQRDCQYFGLDISPRMLAIAGQRNTNDHLIVASIRELPFRSERFDSVIAAAVLHHLPSSKVAVNAIKESVRVTKISGLIFITVWSPADLLSLQKNTNASEAKDEIRSKSGSEDTEGTKKKPFPMTRKKLNPEKEADSICYDIPWYDKDKNMHYFRPYRLYTPSLLKAETNEAITELSRNGMNARPVLVGTLGGKQHNFNCFQVLVRF